MPGMILTTEGHVTHIKALSSKSDLPAASVDWRGARAIIEGGAGEEDIEYRCMKAKDDNYHWVPTARGGDAVT